MVLTLFSCGKGLVPSESITATNFSNIEIQCTVTTLEKNQADGANKALKKAFERLFFIGFPNTISSTPLIQNNTNADKNEQLLKDFLENKKYAPFISSISHQSTKSKSDKSGYLLTNSKMVIDIPSLRRYLETTGATRKFGY
jgi:hypothetical protein